MDKKKYKLLIALSDDDMRAGSSRSAAYLAHELNKLNYDVDLLVPKGKRSLNLLDELKINYFVARYYNWTKKINESSLMKLLRNIRQVFRSFYNKHVGYYVIKRIIKKGSYDLVALNNTWVYLPACVASDLSIPFVWHLREFNEEDHGWTFCNKKKSFSLMANSEALIGISEAILDKYKPLINSSRFYKIYNGIDPKYFFQIKRTPLLNEVINIGMIGRISAGKGQLDFVQAMFSLRDEGVGFKAFIAGEGEHADEAMLAKCVNDLNLQNDITMLGGINDIAAFYESLDILVVCSKKEAFGRVAVEGQMSGCVVVGANSGGIREVIKDRDTGYLFDQGNIHDLSATILEIVHDKKRAQCIANKGRIFALNHFTSCKNAQGVAGVYSCVLQKRKRHF